MRRATLLSYQGRYEEAWRHNSESLRIFAQLPGDRSAGFEAMAFKRAANIAMMQGRYELADEQLLSARSLYERIEDRRWVGLVEADFAQLSLLRGDFESALLFISELLSSEGYSDPARPSGGRVKMLRLKCDAELASGDVHGALATGRAALAAARTICSPLRTAEAKLALARVSASLDTDASTRLFEDAARLFQALGMQYQAGAAAIQVEALRQDGRP